MLRVRTVMTGVAGSPWYTNTYFEGTGTADALDASDRTYDFWDAIKGYVQTGIQIDVEDEVQEILPSDGSLQDVFSVPQAPLVGTNMADPLPRATQMLIRLRTAGVVAGRRVQGRIFLPGWCEGSSTAGVPLPVDRANVENASNAWSGVAPTSDNRMVVWSRPVEGGRAGTVHDVTSLSTWSQWAVLRSRRD